MKTLILNTGVSHSAFDYALVHSIDTERTVGRSMLIADIGTTLYLPTAKSKKLVGGSAETIQNIVDTPYADSICSQLPKSWRFINTFTDGENNKIDSLLESPALDNAVHLVQLNDISTVLGTSGKKYDLITILIYQDPRSIEATEQLASVLKKSDLNFNVVGLDWDRNTTKTNLLGKTIGKTIKVVLETPKIKRAWLSENIKELMKLYK